MSVLVVELFVAMIVAALALEHSIHLVCYIAVGSSS
jgi:hypothetical protein